MSDITLGNMYNKHRYKAQPWQVYLVSILFTGSLCGAGYPPLQQDGGRTPIARPGHTEYAKMARWLVHINNWGTVSTSSSELTGFSYGNAVSYSDGPVERSTGRILFYLTAFDQTAVDLQANPKATLSVCEAQLPGHCDRVDPEDPTCAKVTIAGEIRAVPDEDLDLAKELMFRRHPQMRNWKAHPFVMYELHIGAIKLLDFYGGYEEISTQDYFAAQVVLEEMKSDPCWRHSHRIYCVMDRYEAKKQQAV